LPQHQPQHIGDGALFHHQRAIHVGFAELDLRIEQNTALGRRRDEPDNRQPAGPVAKNENGPPAP
jgi:serine acetyltransferase